MQSLFLYKAWFRRNDLIPGPWAMIHAVYLIPDPWLNLNCFWCVGGDPTILTYWTRVVITLSKLHCNLWPDLGLISTINATIYDGFVERIFWKRTVLFIPTHLDLILLFFSFYFPFFSNRKFGFFHCARIFKWFFAISFWHNIFLSFTLI